MLFTRLTIVSAALWCAAGIAAGITRSMQETAQAPAAESAEVLADDIVAMPKADRLPLPPAEPMALLAKAYADRQMVEAPAPVTVVRIDGPQTVGTTVSVRRHHPTDVCARHGMRKVITRGGRSWRCRR